MIWIRFWCLINQLGGLIALYQKNKVKMLENDKFKFIVSILLLDESIEDYRTILKYSANYMLMRKIFHQYLLTRYNNLGGSISKLLLEMKPEQRTEVLDYVNHAFDAKWRSI